MAWLDVEGSPTIWGGLFNSPHPHKVVSHHITLAGLELCPRLSVLGLKATLCPRPPLTLLHESVEVKGQLGELFSPSRTQG